MIAVFGTLFSLMVFIAVTIEEYQEAECECTEACEELDYEYFDIRKTHGTMECYCQDGNKTVKILY